MLMDIVAAAILAIIQGITAWVPVSSKTMVILAGDAFFGMTFKATLAFALILHLGDLIAAMWRYRSEYASAIKLSLTPKKIMGQTGAGDPLAEQKFLIISIIATAAVAAPLYLLSRKFFTGISGEPLLAAIGLLLIAMAAITFVSRRRPRRATLPGMKAAIATGACQGLAVLPGISRSGITQCAFLLQGVEPQRAVRYSFLMAAPMIALAFIGFYAVDGFAGLPLDVIILGIAISAIASHLTMGFIGDLARKIPAHYFLAAVGMLAMVPMALKLALGVAG